MSITKKCRDCGAEKELSEYYVHKQMADGHLNKCKECVKGRVRKFWADGGGREYDKARQKTEHRKAWQREHTKKMNIKHKEKRQCRIKFSNWIRYHKDFKKPCEVCGGKGEAHHSDYSKPLEVKWLCSKHHKEWHRNNEYVPPNDN